MTDPNIPGDETPDATPTQSLPAADAQPVAAAPLPIAAPPPVEHTNHTRTILEVVGGVVAAGLIIVAGAVGFFVGHATGSDHDGDGRFARSQDGGQFGPQAGGPGLGQALPPQGQGLPPQGQGRGHDQGMPMMPGQGFGQQDQRGIDPDGDNWTGQNRGYDDDGGFDDDFEEGMPMMPGDGLEQQLQPTPQG